MLLGLSERAVRAIEKRALRKLAQHPNLREIWRNFQSGELTEQAGQLSAPEIQALLGLVRNRVELGALQNALLQFQTQRSSGPMGERPAAGNAARRE